MERLTARYNGHAIMAWEHENKYTTEEWIDILTARLAAYEDTGLEPEKIHALQGHPDHAYAAYVKHLFPILERLEELAEAEQLGGLVTLPFAPGVTLVDHSDPERPELLKNFRLAVAYDHNGIVFHQPLDIFLENVQRGYIAQVSVEAERALAGGADHA